jgi:hypothetical protein
MPALLLARSLPDGNAPSPPSADPFLRPGIGRIRPFVVIDHLWCGARSIMDSYAVGFARPDRWSWGVPTEPAHPWHAVEAHRLPAELDGEIELAVCGVIVQVWGSQNWTRVGVGRTACPDCRRITAVTKPLTSAR